MILRYLAFKLVPIRNFAAAVDDDAFLKLSDRPTHTIPARSERALI